MTLEPSRMAVASVGAVATLYLNGAAAGTVKVTGHDTSWGFGRFTPGEGFTPFATAYELWSLLLHDDGDGGRLDRRTAADLAVIENAMDRIKARLFFADKGSWLDVVQLNVDGDLVEWTAY